MSSKLREITAYFRSAVASQVNKKIDFKEDNYVSISFEQLINGRINEKVFSDLYDRTKENDNKEAINIIICAKTIKTIFDSQEKKNNDLEDLTGIYFMPAILRNDGTLLYSQNKLPWIPRDFLQPMTEPVLSVGTCEDYDNFMSISIGEINKITTWASYITFSKSLYESVTKSKFEENSILDIELEEQVYIFKDSTINAVKPIMALYDSLENGYEESKLYENFLNLKYNDLLPLIANNIDGMHKHNGQMGGENSLSPSQRECINHFNNMVDGEILAVNGPPGTGKTTLLQSIVANMYVNSALNKDKPPLIVASSTNNQAVTNIIESFGKTNTIGYKNLEDRWIEGVNSFAVYFPSSNTENNANKKGYQYTNLRGENFIADIENDENIQKSKSKLILNCCIYFNENLATLEECEQKLHSTLSEVDKIRTSILHIVNELKEYDLGDKTLDEFLTSVTAEKSELEDYIKTKNLRIEGWRQHFKNMPMFYKLFNFLKPIKKRIHIKNRLFIDGSEDFLNEFMNLMEIEEKYSFIIKETKEKLHKINVLHKQLQLFKDQYDENLKKLNEMNMDIYAGKSKAYDMNLEEVNKLMDTTLRYIEFWLSVHYFECRWVKGESTLTEKQKGKTYRNVLEKLYSRLSMVAPCYVMTFYQLPKNFLAYEGAGSKSKYLYNFIDLLIVDEAGQVSPEIAACSFSLAKKALVVGDVHQIEPVWSVNRALDKSLVLEYKVIENDRQYNTLEELGLNASNSSVMRVASKSCKYQKYDERGLFLSEHRRCYDEIISFCNKLVYKGNLQPMRGPALLDKNYKLKDIPQMGYKQINTEYSTKKGSSRYNRYEATEIIDWVLRNFEKLKEAYPKEEPSNLLGIITPFKAQVRIIENEFKYILPENIRKYISVGTVHTFQGAERKIIIMSSVYGKADGCYFIDVNKSMLNVAVSRAKDSFLVFGDIDCFKDDKSSASSILKSFIKNNQIQ